MLPFFQNFICAGRKLIINRVCKMTFSVTSNFLCSFWFALYHLLYLFLPPFPIFNLLIHLSFSFVLVTISLKIFFRYLVHHSSFLLCPLFDSVSCCICSVLWQTLYVAFLFSLLRFTVVQLINNVTPTIFPDWQIIVTNYIQQGWTFFIKSSVNLFFLIRTWETAIYSIKAHD